MTSLKAARRPIRELVRLLRFRETYGRPCYLKRNTVHAALIVPELKNGPEGPYAYLRTFQRATIHEAQLLGLIRLGGELVDVPGLHTPTRHWSADPGHMGRTISLTEVAR